jgi:superfamily II DNA or RNA helicase
MAITTSRAVSFGACKVIHCRWPKVGRERSGGRRINNEDHALARSNGHPNFEVDVGLPGGSVLTNWTAHLHTFADALRELGHDPVLLKGGMGAKERTASLARLRPQHGGSPLLVVATGPYAGEGFDCPALDTSFLAAPISFKGRLIQYAGRVLRPCDGKTTAEVHDYHDELTGVLASSLAKRAPGYTSLGFPDPRKLPYTPSAAAVPPVVQASRG